MPGRFKIVLSDLHLGAGREQDGNPLEDFSSDREFVALLQGIAAESDRDSADVELILNGDVFEMLQVPHVDHFDPRIVYPSEQYHSSSEEDSVRKMSIIIEGHRAFFQAIGRFLRVGPPRRMATFVKGNHDLNLHWKGVQDRIRREVAATGGRESLLAFEERSISREGIYVEHGNQYAAALDRVEVMEEPRDPDAPGQLAIPIGSWFVMDVFNKVEREKYWIDGVKPIPALVWYALAYDFAFAAKAIATLARALPGILWEGLLSTEESSGLVMSEDLVDQAKVVRLARRYEMDETFRAQFNFELAEMLSPAPQAYDLELASAAAVSDPVAMGDQFRAKVHSSLFAAASRLAKEEGAKLVLFGHTHDAGMESLPGGSTYINCGTWTWRADFSREGRRRWRDLFEHPEWFTGERRLSYVRIDYDEEGQPHGKLLDYESLEKRQFAPAPVAAPSLWERIVRAPRSLWARIAGSG
jgi:UDP-2,3-diacylglucosamine pyrophosphatase LpxH